MIKVRDLRKRYGSKEALKGISFVVEKGEILGFLGPNGAGKTTTMQILTGYLSPTSGTVTIGEADLLRDPLEVKKQVGYLPENPPVYRDMTVKEYLNFVMELKGVPRKERNNQLSELVERLQLTDVYTRLIGNLSKGYRQRVGLAQAICGDPEVLILDEPTVGLDPQQIITIREFIRELGRDRTVILSTHILPEVSALCERVLIINQGEIVAEGSPAELSHRLQKGQSLRVKIKGESEVVENNLAQISNISQITSVESEETGTCDFIITADGDADIREELFYTMAKANLPILELKPIDLSLEDIFLELVTEESTERGAA
ncbi:MFS transporter [Anoxybacter fermentans]|uniref:MFS transporter n=1 Tax=Anoxybacter fermentans TaxID=1323375 RepID=A0A3Q9HPN2_9FIRM|nr:ATP-binding cassette domain-containing protein [Anoxybacter fermentans]AZR72863.1 MFS transporter [Anoxybacter fermentans]